MDKKLNIIVPEELYERVRKHGWDNRISFAEIVRRGLALYFEKIDKKAKK